MGVILGLDAAWTAGQPTGVALIKSEGSRWRCVAVAPSYEVFLGMEASKTPDWAQGRLPGSTPNPAALLSVAERIAGARVDVVAIDMPVATVSITTRRAADNEISLHFGARHCSAHSPNETRPGPLGAKLSLEFGALGYPVRTANEDRLPGLIEVYPHVALLSLLKSERRIPYKVGKSNDYWPGKSVRERSALLLTQLRRIYTGLEESFGNLGFHLPAQAPTLASLKRFEDVLDALVCAWVGTLYLAGQARAHGDANGAIWCPADVV